MEHKIRWAVILVVDWNRTIRIALKEMEKMVDMDRPKWVLVYQDRCLKVKFQMVESNI